MKKNILFYYKMFFAGGTEHSILKLIEQIYKNYDIIVAYDEEESTQDVLKEIAQYAKVINLNDINTVEVDTCIWCSHSRQGCFTDFAQKVKAKHYYFWCHLLMFETFQNLEFYEDFMENIEKFICVSEVVKKDIITKYPKLEEKCEVIENYLDVNKIIEKSQEQLDLEVDKQKLNIISVSRIAKDKGFHRMKWLCDILNENNIPYDWYVLGTAYGQEVLDEIQGWFADNKNVHFLGYQENVYKYIKQMDYLALLTDRESWGLVISEALILGKPCIVTNFDGVEKQIIDKQNGIILDMNNTENSYEKRINDIVEMKDVLKKNVEQKDYNRSHILKRWSEILETKSKGEYSTER